MRILFTNTKIDFVGARKFAYILTAVIFLPLGVWSIVKGPNYGIEFEGGTLMHVTAQQPYDAAKVRAALDAQGIHGAEIQPFGNPNEFVVRANVQTAAGVDADNTSITATAVRKSLDAAIGAEPAYKVERTEAVGPKVGGELRQKALMAILLSFLAILAYLAVRFEWRFGAAAIVATAHDVLGTVIFITVMQLEVSLVVVGAVLSVLGLSLNETIIIFDRVRENEQRKVSPDLKTVLNLSINETLPRTVLTHGTSLATMLTLIIFGGEVIRPFALVMFWGVFTGIFSSMYIAPGVLMYIRQRWPMLPSAPRAARPAARRV